MTSISKLTTCILLGAVTFTSTTAFGQDLPDDIRPDSHARLSYVKRDNLNTEDQAIFDMLPGQLPSGEVAGPLAWPAYNMGVARALLDLHNAAVATEAFGDYERELATLIACRFTNYSLEWNTHVNSALRNGVPESVINVIKYNQSLHSVPEKDAAIIHFGRQLLKDRKVDSATFANVQELFGDAGAMDLVAIMVTYIASGYYAIAVDEHMANGQNLE